ncbi:SMI1/KNR4 family protein [Yokenella regensburgei]|uniref:hypothetical protein n=1 Tax=Yokenella regensburgei TaxID=158877 RepID=UPI003F17939C
MENNMPEKIPDAILAFITAAVTPGDILLPFHYPQPAQWHAWHSGYRWHGITGENLVAKTPGMWQPGWYLIALNGLDDPFFINLDEAAQGYPVYYAAHGAGSWQAERIAPNLDAFHTLLAQLHHADEATALALLDAHTEPESRFWGELRETWLSEENEEDSDTRVDPLDWQAGRLLITGTGPQKLKVVHVLRKALNLPLAGALGFVASLPVCVGEDYRLRLRPLERALQDTGATLIFEPIGPALETLRLNIALGIGALIACVKAGQGTTLDYSLYSMREGALQEGDVLFVAGGDDDEDAMPTGRYPHFACMGEHFQSVVELAIAQKPHASDAEIIRALNHYLERDDFLDME